MRRTKLPQDTNEEYHIGDRVAQVMLVKKLAYDLVEVPDISVETERSTKGLGSSNKKVDKTKQI
jgi:dUTPase